MPHVWHTTHLTTADMDCCLRAALLLPALPSACTTVAAVVQEQQQSANSLASSNRMVVSLGGQLVILWQALVECGLGPQRDLKPLLGNDAFVATLPPVASLAVALVHSWQLRYGEDNRARGMEEAAAVFAGSVRPALVAACKLGHVVLAQVITWKIRHTHHTARAELLGDHGHGVLLFLHARCESSGAPHGLTVSCLCLAETRTVYILVHYDSTHCSGVKLLAPWCARLGGDPIF